MRRICLIAAAAVLCGHSPASAAIVQLGFDIRVDHSEAWTGPAAGSTGHITLAYDSAVVGTPGGLAVTLFPQPAEASIRLETGAFAVTMPLDQVAIQGTPNFYGLNYVHNAGDQFFGTLFAGSSVVTPAFLLALALPTSITCCKEGADFRFPASQGSYKDGLGIIFWTVTPLPSALLLFGPGLAGLAAFARVRTRSSEQPDAAA